MLQGNTGKDQVVPWRSAEHTILDHQYIAVCTFCYTVATVEYGFLAVLFNTSLISDHTGDQVQGLDIAVQESGIFHGDQTEGSGKGDQIAGDCEDHQVWLYGSRWELVAAEGSSTGALPVEHAVITVIGIDTLLQGSNQFLSWHGKRNFQ